MTIPTSVVRTVILAALICIGLSHTHEAHSVIDIKVSVKWVRSSDGSIGPGDLTSLKNSGAFEPCDETVTEQDFLDRIDYANKILARSGRGYRFVVEFATISPPAMLPGGPCADKGTPGALNACGGLTSCDLVTPPPIVISEIMPIPTMVSGGDGEWFELQNTTAANIDLEKWIVEDGGSQSFQIVGSLVVPANGVVVLGRRDDYNTNGNMAVDYAYGAAMTLDNSGDEIILRDDNGVEVDRVEYNDDKWPVVSGASLCLKSPTHDNNCPNAWSASNTSYYWTEWTTILASCRGTLQDMAMADTTTWKWDADAFNIYMSARCSGGASGTTRFSHVTMAIGQNEAGGFLRPFHELGHALGICHTHDCTDTWNPLPCFCVEGTVGLDCLADTPPDSAKWGNNESAGALADTVSMNAYSVLYDALDDSEKRGVLDVVYNIMSYHRDDDWGFPNREPPLDCDLNDIDDISSDVPADSLPDICRHRLSPDQLDRISDFSNTMLRRARDLGVTGRFAGGLTHFVDRNAGSCPPWCGSENSQWECWPGNSIVPHATLSDALNAAVAEHEPGMEHIIMMRPGNYNEPMTITDRVDLRGTRGTVIIGK